LRSSDLLYELRDELWDGTLKKATGGKQPSLFSMYRPSIHPSIHTTLRRTNIIKIEDLFLAPKLKIFSLDPG